MTVALETEDVEQFRDLVLERLGLQFDDSRMIQLAEVLRERIHQTSSNHYASYLRRLTSSETSRDEFRALAEHLTVGETYFFRYPEQGRAFVDVVLQRVGLGDSNRQLRILCAGCATGEEPYTLSILLHEHIPDVQTWDITIEALDIKASSLRKAVRGRFGEYSLRQTAPELRDRWFRVDDKSYVLNEDVRSLVIFEERNIFETDSSFWQPRTFDIIFCRNVLIYFSPETIRATIARFAQSLVPNGFLFLGHAETLRGISQEFHLVHAHDAFYYQLKSEEQPPMSHGTEAIDFTPAPSKWVPEGDSSWVDVIRDSSNRISSLTAPLSNFALSEPVPLHAQDIDEALDLIGRERFDDARALLAGLPPEVTTGSMVLLLNASISLGSGDRSEAEQIARQVLEQDEFHAGAHYLIALCREHAGDLKRAAWHDQTAIYLDPGFAMPHLHLGLLSKRSADRSTAHRELWQALTLLADEDEKRIALFGGGFNREALLQLCRTGLHGCEK